MAVWLQALSNSCMCLFCSASRSRMATVWCSRSSCETVAIYVVAISWKDVTFSSASLNSALWSSMVFRSTASRWSAAWRASSSHSLALSAIALNVATSSSSFCIVVVSSTSICVSTDSRQVAGSIVAIAGGVSIYVVWSEEGVGRVGAGVLVAPYGASALAWLVAFPNSTKAL